jgi:hypothetical protein
LLPQATVEAEDEDEDEEPVIEPKIIVTYEKDGTPTS